MKIVMSTEDDRVMAEYHKVEQLDFDDPKTRRNILLFILEALARDQVERWFDESVKGDSTLRKL